MQVRRSKKRILSDKVGAAWFKADVMGDLLVASTKCAIKQAASRLTPVPTPPPAPVFVAGTKRHGGTLEPLPAKQFRNRDASRSKRQEKLRAVDAMEKAFGDQARTSNAEQVLAWIDGQFKDVGTRPAISGLMSKVCRNCISVGRGVQHIVVSSANKVGTHFPSHVPSAPRLAR